jgi:Cytochrome P460
MRWLLLLIAACSEPLRDDVTPLAELGYQSWTKQVQVHGDAPGHTGFRTIYANPLAADGLQSLELGYQEGAILVKEVFDDNAGVRGALRHIAVMRRIGPVTRVLEDDGGWYFTEAKGNGPEEHFDFCFRRCHAAAPYNGAWLDYRE